MGVKIGLFVLRRGHRLRVLRGIFGYQMEDMTLNG
jgi:hypothetical protein